MPEQKFFKNTGTLKQTNKQKNHYSDPLNPKLYRVDKFTKGPNHGNFNPLQCTTP